MRRRVLIWGGSAAAVLIFTACSGETGATMPPPEELTREATGFYCQMIVADHPGPKAQIFLRGRKKPVWFPSVRDAFAFLMLPSEDKGIRAIYVTDMAVAKNFATPEAGAWTEGKSAYYVLGSDLKGGMGLPEVVPFSRKAAALAYMEEHGGQLSRMADVPEDYVFPDGQDVDVTGQEQREARNGAADE